MPAFFESIGNLQLTDPTDGFYQRQPQTGRAFLLCPLIKPFEDTVGIQGPLPFVRDTESRLRKENPNLAILYTVDKSILQQIGHQHNGQRFTYPDNEPSVRSGKLNGHLQTGGSLSYKA